MSIKLTKYSEAGGCGCKISPNILNQILGFHNPTLKDSNILLGYKMKDDATIYKLNSEIGLVSTVDCITPIVDEPYNYGRIAAANSISDVFAMGGTPFLATAILGWPLDKINYRYSREILQGAADVCSEINIVLGGGHTINNPQPIFGLSVQGKIDLKNIKQNSNARMHDKIFLTKPLGIGILSTALKMGLIESTDYKSLIKNAVKLNDIGEKIGKLDYVSAMTDVTGFGLLGHLLEVCRASKLNAEINFNKIHFMSEVEKYVKKDIITSGGKRNWESYKEFVSISNFNQIPILSDPQTNGGLLVTVKAEKEKAFVAFLKANNLQKFSRSIGNFSSQNSNNSIRITVN